MFLRATKSLHRSGHQEQGKLVCRGLAPAQQGECGRRRQMHRKKRHIKQYHFIHGLPISCEAGTPACVDGIRGKGPVKGE